MDYTTWSGGPTFTIQYNPLYDSLDVNAVVPKKQVLAIVFGPKWNITNSDMLLFSTRLSSRMVMDANG